MKLLYAICTQKMGILAIVTNRDNHGISKFLNRIVIEPFPEDFANPGRSLPRNGLLF